jgi:superfamily II DNA helicase RecQ
MLIRVFTLAFDPATERFNDDAVRDFIADKDLASVSDHFFMKDDAPYLALVVRYRLPGPASSPAAPEAAGRRERDETWRDALDKADWPLFNTLRDWRGEQARANGIPSYVICNNRQLVDVVNKRPATLTDLGHIDGFGDAKLKKYGSEMLAIVAKAGPRPAKADPNPAPAAPSPAEAGHAGQ